jgi:hypothetical protein
MAGNDSAFAVPPPDPERTDLRDHVRRRARPEGNQLLVLRLGIEDVPDHLLQQQRVVSEEGNRYGGGSQTAGSRARARRASSTGWMTKGGSKVNPDGTISVAWWLRDENGEWKPWMNNTFPKLS